MSVHFEKKIVSKGLSQRMLSCNILSSKGKVVNNNLGSWMTGWLIHIAAVKLLTNVCQRTWNEHRNLTNHGNFASDRDIDQVQDNQ